MFDNAEIAALLFVQPVEGKMMQELRNLLHFPGPLALAFGIGAASLCLGYIALIQVVLQ